MSKKDKLIQKILNGNADAGINFTQLCVLLDSLGFEVRVKGSHYVFRKKGIRIKINLQKDGAKAKPYQIRQIRSIMLAYDLTGDE